MDRERVNICKSWLETARQEETQLGHFIKIARKPSKWEQRWIWSALAVKRVEVEVAWVSALTAFLKVLTK